MKTYEVGDSVSWRRSEGADLEWGVVKRVVRDDAVVPVEYHVRPDDYDGGNHTTVTPDQIVDLTQVSADAGAALDRIHRQDRAKADLLDYLLGELAAYADREGEIRYTAHLVGDIRPQKARHSVREIVDRYTDKRAAVYEG